jgi:hypothetical protein
MRRMFIGLFAVMALGLIATSALATPNVNSAIIHERVFNDCPTSILTTNNSYPASISIQDEINCENGYANLHNWHFSEDGVNDAVFTNDSSFHMHADLVISGTGECEAGLQVAPWWSQNVDGRFNVRSTDGEIACFGGRLPFYSFTGTYGLHYVKGDPIHLEITYLPNDLTQTNPATIEYELMYNNVEYTSGPLAFDEGNPNEDPPYGLWGILNDARVGGHMQVFIANGGTVRTEWSGIYFEALGQTPVQPTTWGRIKGMYR